MFSSVGAASAASISKSDIKEVPNKTIVVNDLSLKGINDAINNAADGDTIIINGSINENGNVVCGKSLSIVGQDKCELKGLHWNCAKDIEFKNINFYESSGGCGGAIYSTGSVIVNNSNFTNNHAVDYGGAIYAKYDVSVSDCNFEYNCAEDNDGGAIWSKSSVNVSDSKFIGNHADVDGGAIISDGDVNVVDSSFDSNYCSGAKIFACYGGSIRCTDGSVTAINSNFTNNRAVDYGGAIYSKYDVKMTDCNLESNSVESKSGGAIYCVDGSVNICNSHLSNNSVKGSDGGAIYCDDGGVVLTSSSFINNYAKKDGGAVWSDDGVTVKDCLFKNNFVDGKYGGAIYMDDSYDLRVSGSSFYSNSANEKGGAIYCEGNFADVYLDSLNSFEDNYAIEGSVIFADGYFKSISGNWWGSANPDWDSGLAVEWKCWPWDNINHHDECPLNYNPNL